MVDTNLFHSGGFTHQRMILVRSDDAHLGIFTPEDDLSLEQACDGPRYLVIGRQVQNERLERIAHKLGLDPKTLIEFRDV